MSEKHCGTCKHWHESPQPLGPVAIGEGVKGACREQLYVVGTPMQAPNGSIVVNIQALYPHVSSNFPACSRHAKVIEGVGIATE